MINYSLYVLNHNQEMYKEESIEKLNSSYESKNKSSTFFLRNNINLNKTLLSTCPL